MCWYEQIPLVFEYLCLDLFASPFSAAMEWELHVFINRYKREDGSLRLQAPVHNPIIRWAFADSEAGRIYRRRSKQERGVYACKIKMTKIISIIAL